MGVNALGDAHPADKLREEAKQLGLFSMSGSEWKRNVVSRCESASQLSLGTGGTFNYTLVGVAFTSPDLFCLCL